MLSEDWGSKLAESHSFWMIDSLHSKHPEAFIQDHCPPEFETSNLNEEKYFLDEIFIDEKIAQDVQDKLMRENCDRFLELKAISDLVFPIIDSIFTAKKVDLNYKYLAVMESGLNPGYVQGTEAGLWALDRIDAQRFGIESVDSVDFRYDLINSTLSVSEKLSKLDQSFDNEVLILSAWYEGVLPVKKRLHRSADDMELFIDQCPKSTMEWLQYYKGVSEYFSFLKSAPLGSEMRAISSELVNASPKKKSPINSYAKVLGVSEEVILNWNPQFTSGYVIPNDAMPLRLSPSLHSKFIALEDSIYSYAEKLLELERTAAEKAREEQERIRAQEEIIHTVRSGEVLGVIAENYGVSVRELKEWNRLRRDMIYVGQKLSVYGVAAPPKKVEEARSTEQNTSTAGKAKDGDAIIYTVRSGDNLWVIAKKYPGVSADDIMQWNKITEDLKPGQELIIYP